MVQGLAELGADMIEPGEATEPLVTQYVNVDVPDTVIFWLMLVA